MCETAGSRCLSDGRCCSPWEIHFPIVPHNLYADIPAQQRPFTYSHQLSVSGHDFNQKERHLRLLLTFDRTIPPIDIQPVLTVERVRGCAREFLVAVAGSQIRSPARLAYANVYFLAKKELVLTSEARQTVFNNAEVGSRPKSWNRTEARLRSI